MKQEFIKGREESIYESITHYDVTENTDELLQTIGKCKSQLGDYFSRHAVKVTCKKCLKKLSEMKASK